MTNLARWFVYMCNDKVKLSLQERSCLWCSIIGNSTPNDVLRKESDPLSKIGGMGLTLIPPIFKMKAVKELLLLILKEHYDKILFD
jgi:hypothetical protein